MPQTIHVTCWNEFRHEKQHEKIKSIYPDGIHAAIADHLNAQEDMTARLAALDDPEHGLTEDVLDKTDVLIWWGHCAHGEVQDEIVDRVQNHVLNGMGLIALHSSQGSKIFHRLMGTSCNVIWREAGEKERIWVVQQGHPIARGLGHYFELEQTEMYGELFDIPQPDQLVFISWFPGGEVFRSGCCWLRGNGRVFYFRPGHETYPVYRNQTVLQVIANGVRWAAPTPDCARSSFGNRKPLETI